MPTRAVLLFAAAAASPLVAAPLDHETKTPYRWRVVVSAAAHPTITPAVRARLCRELKVALQADIGPALGTVDVLDLDSLPAADREPLFASFSLSGFDALDRDEFRTLTGVKTHFVRLEVSDGRYQLTTRQHDGDTGLISPLVRTRATVDVTKVGRLAGLMIAKDFGPVATADRVPGDATRATVTFRGGELPGFAAQVKVGDVLAFSVIRERARPAVKGATPLKFGEPVPVDLVARPQEFTYLLITEPGLRGRFGAKVLTRWATPFPTGRNVAGYRAMKWHTAEALLSVRLRDEKGSPHPPDFRPQVWAGEGAFTDTPTDREAFRGADALYQSVRLVKGLACVKVQLGGGKTQPFPVPVLGADAPTVLRFNIDEKEIARAEYEQACEAVRRKVDDVTLTQTELFRGLGPLITAGEFKAALARATSGLKALTDADAELGAELTKLGTNPLAQDSAAARVIAAATERLKTVRATRPDLVKKIEDMKVAIARADDPVRFEKEFKANELLRQAREFVARGEVPEAAAKYDELFELTKDAAVTAAKDKLMREWAPKSDAHGKARDFLLKQWRPAAELPEFVALAGKLSGTVDVFAENDDRLSLLNLRASVVSTDRRLRDLLDFLDGSADGDRAKIADIKSVSDALVAADKKAVEALAKLDPKK